MRTAAEYLGDPLPLTNLYMDLVNHYTDDEDSVGFSTNASNRAFESVIYWETCVELAAPLPDPDALAHWASRGELPADDHFRTFTRLFREGLDAVDAHQIATDLTT